MYLLKNGVIFDALHDGEALDILVDGDKIAAVGAGLAAPEGAEVIDLGGRMVFPGFIDAHVHVCISPDGFSDEAIAAWARNGVATVRDLGMLGAHPLESYLAFLKEHDTPQFARVLTAGQYIDVEGGYGSHAPGATDVIGRIIETPEQAANEVAYEVAAGVQGIKIGLASGGPGPARPEMDDAQLAAIAAKCRELGVWSTAHILTSHSCERVVAAGFTEAAHTPDDPMSDALIAEMVEKGVFMDTTIGDPNITPPPPGMMPPEMAMSDEDFIAHTTARQAALRENCKRFYDAGGTLVLGTDLIGSSDFDRDARIPTTEMAQLYRAGVPTAEIIKAGTLSAARACGIADEEGTVEAGKRANLVAIDGALDETFAALRTPAFVMNRGTVLKGI
jgi:imidazolonepropionase-like amidohydrolase